LQLSYGAGSAVVNAFAAIDEWLETKRWFSTLVPQPFPSEVMDTKTGSMKRGCKEVSRGPGDTGGRGGEGGCHRHTAL